MPEPLIQTRNLGREFRAEGLRVSALRDVTLEVDHGEFVAVIGPSGSGKSTLMHLLGLLDEPSAGSYRLAGKETRGLHPDARADLRRRDLGFVFQSYNLLARSTALENVALPLVYSGMPRRKRRDRAAEMLAFVGLEHRIGPLAERAIRRRATARRDCAGARQRPVPDSRRRADRGA